MSEKPTVVEITDHAHLAATWRWIGMVEIEQKLGEVPDFQKVPGFGLAMAVVAREIAELRSRNVMSNLGAVAKAGIDVAKVQNVALETGPKGSLRLMVTMMDLADLAGGGSS